MDTLATGHQQLVFTLSSVDWVFWGSFIGMWLLVLILDKTSRRLFGKNVLASLGGSCSCGNCGCGCGSAKSSC